MSEGESLKAITLIQRGVLVHAIFRWISLALPRNDAYAAQIDFSPTPDSDISSLRKRYREYIVSRICLSNRVSIDPLHLHSLALLDAYCLSKCFKAWVSYLADVSVRQRRESSVKLRIAIKKMRSFAGLRKMNRSKWLPAEHHIGGVHTEEEGFSDAHGAPCVHVTQSHQISNKVILHRAFRIMVRRRLVVATRAMQSVCLFEHYRAATRRRALTAWTARMLSDSVVRKIAMSSSAKLSSRIVVVRTNAGVLARYHLRKWVSLRRKRSRLETSSGVFLRRRFTRIVAKSFGAWWTMFAYRHRLNISARRVRLRLNHQALWVSWFAWRHVAERSVLLRSDARNTIDVRNIDNAEFLSSSLGHSRRIVLRKHALLARKRILWMNLSAALGRSFFNYFARRAMMKWRLVHAEASIVVCLQRIWRGYLTRVFMHPGKFAHLRRFSTKINSVLAFRRRIQRRKIFKILCTYRNQAFQKWFGSSLQSNMRRVIATLRKTILVAVHSERQSLMAESHFALCTASKLIDRLKGRRYERLITRSTITMRNFELAKFALAAIRTQAACRRRVIRACAFYDTRFRTQSLQLLRNCWEYIKWRRNVPIIARRVRKLVLQKALRAVRQTIQARANFKRLLASSNLTSCHFRQKPILRALLEFSQIRSVCKRISSTFHLHHRVRTLLSRYIRFVRRGLAFKAWGEKAGPHNLRCMNRKPLVYLRGLINVRRYYRHLAFYASKQHQRYSLSKAFSCLSKHSKSRRLLRSMNSGSDAQVKVAIAEACKNYGLRQKYVYVGSLSIKASYAQPQLWNLAHLKYSISNAIVADDDVKRRQLLRVTTSRLSVVKKRVLRSLYHSRLLRQFQREKPAEAKHARMHILLQNLRNLYSHMLKRRQHRSRTSKILKDDCQRITLGFFLRLRTFNHLQKVKMQFYAVRRLRFNVLVAFRHLRKVCMCSKKAKKILSIIQRRALLRTLYILSKEKELCTTIKAVQFLAERARKRHACRSFFRQLIPIVREKRKLVRITRCFYLRHYIRVWLNSTAAETTIFRLQSRARKRLYCICFAAWCVYAKREASLKLSFFEVKRRRHHHLQLETLCEWVKAIHDSRLRAKYEIIQRKNLLRKKLSILKHWQHHALFREISMWKSAKRIFLMIFAKSQLRAKQKHLVKRSCFSFRFRSILLAFRNLRLNSQLRRKRNAKVEDVNSVLLIQKCHAKLLQWRKSTRIKSNPKWEVIHSISTALDAEPPIRGKRHISCCNHLSQTLKIRLNRHNTRQYLHKWGIWVTEEKKIRLAQNMRQHFDVWKAISTSHHLKRLAFYNRIRHVWQDILLSFGFRGFLQNRKVGKVYHRNLLCTKRRVCAVWLAKYKNRCKVRLVIRTMSSSFALNALKKAWNYWKVLNGPARRFETRFLQETIFNRWFNYTISWRHYRRVTLNNVLRGWHDAVFHKGLAYRDVHRGRHLLLNMITKLRQHGESIIREAFWRWSRLGRNSPQKLGNTQQRYASNASSCSSKVSIRSQNDDVSRIWRDSVNRIRLSKQSYSSRFSGVSSEYSNLAKSLIIADDEKKKKKIIGLPEFRLQCKTVQAHAPRQMHEFENEKLTPTLSAFNVPETIAGAHADKDKLSLDELM